MFHKKCKKCIYLAACIARGPREVGLAMWRRAHAAKGGDPRLSSDGVPCNAGNNWSIMTEMISEDRVVYAVMGEGNKVAGTVGELIDGL